MRTRKDWRTPQYKHNRKAILDSDADRCGICGRLVDRGLAYPHPMSASVDHIVPRAVALELGWPLEQINDRANLTLAHYGCNNRKQAGDAALMSRPPSPWDL